MFRSRSFTAAVAATPFHFLRLPPQMGEDSLQTLELPPLDPTGPRRVFLEVSRKDGLYPMMPHSMYCLPLWPGINLVLITKVRFPPRIHGWWF